jgi:hypothetical protein
MFVVHTTKNGGFTLTKQMFLFLRLQYVSAQTGHHRVIREEYNNDDVIRIKLEVLGRNNRLFSSDATQTALKTKKLRGHTDSKVIS